MSSSDEDWTSDVRTEEDADEVSRLKSIVDKFLLKETEEVEENNQKVIKVFADNNGNIQGQEIKKVPSLGKIAHNNVNIKGQEIKKVPSLGEISLNLLGKMPPPKISHNNGNIQVQEIKKVPSLGKISHEKEKSASSRVESIKAKLKKSTSQNNNAENVLEVGKEIKAKIPVNGSLNTNSSNTDVDKFKELVLNNETQKNDIKQLNISLVEERERSCQIEKDLKSVINNLQKSQQTLIQINITQTQKIENLSETTMTLQKQVKMYSDEFKETNKNCASMALQLDNIRAENEIMKEKLFAKVEKDNKETKDKVNVFEELINAQIVLNKKERKQPITGTTVKFSVSHGSDTIMKSGASIYVSTRHQCISLMKEYENKSMEELRHEDYLAGRKGSGADTTLQNNATTKEQELEIWRKDIDDKIDKLDKLNTKNIQLKKVGSDLRKKLTQAHADHTKEKMSLEANIDSLKEERKKLEEKVDAEKEEVQKKLETGGAGDCSEYIKLNVVGPDSNEIHYRVKQNTEMGKLMKSHSEKIGVPVSSLEFFFDEERINDYETAETLQMEQNDVVEVRVKRKQGLE